LTDGEAGKRRGIGTALRRALGGHDIVLDVEERRGGESLLMNHRRRSVFEWVGNHPCAHLRLISRALSVPVQTLRWHTGLLVRKEFLSERRIAHKRVFFLNRSVDEEDVPLFIALNHKLAMEVFSALPNSGGITRPVIVERTGSYAQAVQYHLNRLKSLGVIDVKGKGRSAVYRRTRVRGSLMERYSERENGFLNWILTKLDEDGLTPRLKGMREGRAVIIVSDGRAEYRLRILLNPALFLPE